MKIFHTFDSGERFVNPVLTIGNYDGVHVGHQRIIRQVVNKAREISGTPMLMSFYPHPHSILKPDSYSDHYPASSINEWFCARLAKALKLPITLVELRYVPSSIYLISRFDRYFASGKWWRKHVIDGAQLLSLYAGNKYQRSGAKGILDIISLVRSKAPTRIRLFQWTLFNVLIGNNDAHLKNVSFVVFNFV